MTFDPERVAAGRSDHVGLSEHVLLAVGRELLRPVHDRRFEEAAATQLEKGGEVPHHAQTAGGREEKIKERSQTHE